MLIVVDIYEDTMGNPITLPYPQEDVTPTLLGSWQANGQGAI